MKTLSIFLLPLLFATTASAYDPLDNQPATSNPQTFQPGISGKDSTNSFVTTPAQSPALADTQSPAPQAQKASAPPAATAKPSAAPSFGTIDTSQIPDMHAGSPAAMTPIRQSEAPSVDPYFGHAPVAVPPAVTPSVQTTSIPVVQPKPEVHTGVDGPSEPITLYASGNYRLRKGPWKRPILTIIPKGAAFHVLRKEGQWYVVEFNGKQGYVFEEGITHPLAKAIQQQEGLQDLSEDEAAEVAACVTEHALPNLPFEMQKFVKNVQSELQPYVDQQKTVDSVASKKRYSRKRKPLAVETTPASGPHLVTSKHPAAGVDAPAEQQASSGVSGDATQIPLPPERPNFEKQPNQNPVRAKKVRQELSNKNARLAKACWAAASAPRKIARFRCQALGRGYPCGTVSGVRTPKYMCLKGVMECLKDALNINLPIKDDSFASKQRAMQSVGTKLGVNSCREAPVGSVCIYTASYHDYGHIEVKIMRQDPTTGVSRIYYCSDFCSDHPVDEYTNGKHKANHTFKGAYGL